MLQYLVYYENNLGVLRKALRGIRIPPTPLCREVISYVQFLPDFYHVSNKQASRQSYLIYCAFNQVYGQCMQIRRLAAMVVFIKEFKAAINRVITYG